MMIANPETKAGVINGIVRQLIQKGVPEILNLAIRIALGSDIRRVIAVTRNAS